MSLNQTETPHGRKPWLTISLALLALVTFFMMSGGGQTISRMGGGYGVSSSNTMAPTPPTMGIAESAQGVPRATQVMAPDYYPQPYYGGTPAATDTREFNKISYSAVMRTRSVQDLVRRTETTVRGFDGRVDQTSSAEKYGYVSFVIPATKFEEFRTEIESFVRPRFLKVDISSQNLLSQKQSIEETQKQVEKNIADLQTERKQLVASHASAVKSLQSQIDANTNTQTALRAEVTNDPARQASIALQLNQLSAELITLKSRLANENSNYVNNIASIDSQIKYTNENLTGVKQQDQNLLDNVATVNGTISFNWISLWEIMQLYLPGYWIPSILAVSAMLAYLWERRRGHFQ
ncbi:hypothetical protein A2851_01160 [Candidatus Kaiserbacteria bacterium RIFCSPHIGHO2_01_FULL_53_29]|uniref:DUF4349 domain-containing protein n=1 Tax=Candidatus Kaiserbacteria bacterium RIFCSPHIGHO2_01_FULL_53_29 TaxID=1798480 RepID=A0A1F6CYK6_9BACT|nr:MAG: hypothetical protein A2851_01160 [Candidatus Kaiserbacteria bacterium RIFCSPHIGHO2_01_FULL_53_29]